MRQAPCLFCYAPSCDTVVLTPDPKRPRDATGYNGRIVHRSCLRSGAYKALPFARVVRIVDILHLNQMHMV